MARTPKTKAPVVECLPLRRRQALTAKLLALHDLDREVIFRDLLESMPGNTAEQYADQIKTRAYWGEVRSIALDYKTRIAKGEWDDRDSLIEDLEQTIDGHSLVIYTAQAQEVLTHSENADAYASDFGTEGMIEGDSIAWSRLAYAALLADVHTTLSAYGVDVNADPPTIEKGKGSES